MYKIILPNFQGPLDLLIFFIKRDQLDLFNIPIAKITEEFLSYIKLIQSLDLEISSEFLVMAATLMQIKSQMLLPQHQSKNPTDEISDPRQELVDKIIEYEKIKESSQKLAELIERNNHTYFRGTNESQFPDFSRKYITFKKLRLTDLLKILQSIEERHKLSPQFSEVKLAKFNIDIEIRRIEEVLLKIGQINFYSLLQDRAKTHIILTFVSILELIKQKKAIALQNKELDDFIVFKTGCLN